MATGENFENADGYGYVDNYANVDVEAEHDDVRDGVRNDVNAQMDGSDVLSKSGSSVFASFDAKAIRGMVILAATPIGNAADASQRLKDLLSHADIVAAEDTRRLYDLARRLGVRISGRVVAYHDHNERDKSAPLLDQVEQGASIVVVSDAGMPTISDPGLAIVREAIERGLPVTCAPGPSAVLDALALSGLPTDRFCFEGFAPRKHSERMKRLRSLESEMRTMIFYEAPHRIAETIDDLLEAFGPDRMMALARELTKDYEQVRRGTISQIRDSIINDPPRGEIVLVIAGASAQEAQIALESTQGVYSVRELARKAIELSVSQGLRIKESITAVVRDHPLPDGSFMSRKDVYAHVLEIKDKQCEQ